MTAAASQADGLPLFLPIADHGDLVSALPFFLPALLIVGGLLVMRAMERRRHDDPMSDARRETRLAPLVREDSREESS